MPAPENVEIATFDGLKLAGHFYSAGSHQPCVIMSQGFSGLKEHFLPDYAQRFNEAGYSVLTYDNRCWGSSEGLPRNHVDPFLQLRDYVDAFDFATTLPSVDRTKIVFWGSSMSGGNVISAAAIEKRVCAVISQVPFVSGEQASQAFGPMHEIFLNERGAVRQGAAPTMVPVTAETVEEALSGTCKAILPDPDAVGFHAEMDRRGYKREKMATLQSALTMALHEPHAVIHRIAPIPLLMVLGSRDVTIPTRTQLAMYSKALEPKRLRIIKDAGHFDPYHGEAFEQNIQAQVDFLKEFV
ncbi:Alpha/Beta hydrolase protein [Lophiotrema nucula]|uniref:Alpha/Beta hydrolase protein n=1 Tax=Lophiotrema nucula TaxID=690887 RepID=A0A6A5ZEK6_9PLEO|nr:Alpha/Beta hydrolase protein [Lophiotrema nucula]